MKKLKIAIIGPSNVGGGYQRVLAYKKYLQYKHHNVETIEIPNQSRLFKIWFYYQALHARTSKNILRLMEKLSDKLENKIIKNKYDVVIGVHSKLSYVLTKELNCLKIFSCQSLEADERYFSGNYSLEEIHNLREIELEIMKKSDFVIFPWKTTEKYVRKYIWNGKNFVTIKTCCYPKNKTASYYFPISIVSLGNLQFYWANKELLSHLTNISPYIIDIYGKYKPEKKYHLSYKGYAKSLDVFYNYQFGLNTVTKDLFRQNHFSSKIMSYLAYGLPVLYPEWQKYPNELKGCIPYNEDNFIEIIEKYSEIDKWNKISEDAAKQGRELDWKITLKPLDKLIEKYK